MKALAPSRKNKLIFSAIFNLFILSVLYFVTTLTWKLVGAVAFCNLLILSIWLPKTVEQMDEREKTLYLKASYSLFSVSSFMITLMFGLHIVFFQNMSVAEFVIYTGVPLMLNMVWQSYLLKRDLAEDVA